MTAVTSKEHRTAATAMRGVLATYSRQKDLIALGAYQAGSDPRTDDAINRIDAVNTFLRQPTDEKVPREESVEQLCAMFSE
jgi:flagellar biosynthesis/type III secretory pathway ATPase